MSYEQNLSLKTKDEIKDIVSVFENMSRAAKRDIECDKLFCSTCGGLAFYTQKNIDEDTLHRVGRILDEANCRSFGVWQDLVAHLFLDKYSKELEDG